MATLLDAYALIALLKEEAAADDVELLVRKGAAITSVNLAECIDRLVSRDGFAESLLRELLGPLGGVGLAVLAVSEAHAWRAASLRARYYHRSKSALSLADCVFLAAAGPDDSIATADPAVLKVARAEGIASVALPARGRRP